jgi:uncharacterized YccA/Bax inhibitor family protein
MAAFRSGNPVLKADTFSSRAAAGEAMTVEGTVNKTALALGILVVMAAVAWNTRLGFVAPGLLFVLALLGLGIAILTVIRKGAAPYTAPLYAAVEGLLLGGISALFEAMYPGIVFSAVSLTIGTLVGLLAAYRSRMIRATENFKLGVVAATGGIFLVYVVTMVLGLFGVRVPLIHESGPVGIAFSLFVVVIAALNLVLDFDFIEQGAASSVPKYLESYAAFGLLVTLVWLYIEILHLLAKLRGRD